MEADWEEISCATFPVPTAVSVSAANNLGGLSIQQQVHQQQATPYATAVAFDTTFELLWIGASNGRVISYYYGQPLQRYTAWRAQPEEAGVIRQFLFNEKGVIILGTQTILYVNRRGMQHWLLHYDEKREGHKSMRNLQCMSFTSKTTEILVAGAQETMLVIDLNKGEVVKQIPTEYHYTIMKKSRAYICAATTTGFVHFLDPTTFQITKMWPAHPAYINDMDVRGDLVVTCGGTIKQLPTQAGPTKNPDHYVNAYDLSRNAASLKPVSLAVAAAHARLHPKMSSTTVVVSPHGQMHVVDLLNPNAKPTVTKMVPVSMGVKLFEVAPSAQAFVLTDGECNSRLWGSPTKLPPRFNDMGAQPEIPGPAPHVPDMNWSLDTPLSTIGMPYYREQLFSALPLDLISDVAAPPLQLAPSFLATLKKTEFGLYGPNTRGMLRNQQEDTRAALKKAANAVKAPKFLSEKARESAMSPGPKSPALAKAVTAEETSSDTTIESLKPEAPPMYKNYEIRYSKFGVDDFDFGFYNKTGFSGLENQIPNSYANPLLQLMNYTPLLRNLALQHVATSCLEDACILCELGFVFDMLEKAGGASCHATNLLTAISNNSAAVQEKLIEDENKTRRLTDLVQGLCRFFFSQMAKDYKTCQPASTRLEQSLFAELQAPLPIETIVDKVLTMAVKKSQKCGYCRNAYSKVEPSHVTELLYPAPRAAARGGKATKTTFSQVLKMSVERETVQKGWCPACQRYMSLQMRRTIDSSVPAVLALNAAINTPEARRLWATPGWLPQEIGIIVDQQQFFCYEGQDLELHLQRGMHKITVYSLVGMVVNIEETPPRKQHLAALINVAHSEAEASPSSKWHIFNDFCVEPVSAAEALTFNTTWKSPSVIMYQLKAANNRSNHEWKTKLDTSVLCKGPSPQCAVKKYEPLDLQTEMPGPESMVALDAEFVLLRDAEIHLNADGQTETIRPKQLVAGRISVIRGQGERLGVPLIDDYISIKWPIADHLTTYSGLQEGDLDPRTSKHNLVPLKVAYRKLWLLVNLGCKFVGHGLKQDLRVINIQIPRAQVADTIELYNLATQRKLSLKFLSWWILKEKIQIETHDSIEDSLAALRLYKKYLEFQEAGNVDEMIEEIYAVGKKYKFKPPPGKGEESQDMASMTETGAEGAGDGDQDRFNPGKGETIFSE